MLNRVVLLLIVCAVALRAAAQEADKRPNILFAIEDDWGYPHAGVYGYRAARTPAFDGLAAQGILFNRAYCAAPTCTASRGSMLRGQAPHQLGDGGGLWSHLPARFGVYPYLLEDGGHVGGARAKAWGSGWG